MVLCRSVGILCLPLCTRTRHDAVAVGDCDSRKQEGDVDCSLGDYGFCIVRVGIDEGLEQVDRRNADDRRGEFDF